jgi:hypothetical protein
MEEYAIGRSSVPSAWDVMFNYDQRKLRQIVAQIVTQVGKYVERET